MNTSRRYGILSVGLHWLMLLLIIAVYTCIDLTDSFPKGSDTRQALKTWHMMLGLSVLVLVTIRLAARLSGPTPRIDPDMVRWQKRSATTMHVALYVFMIGMPVAGWLMTSAAGKPIPFFGMELPALMGKNMELAKQIKEIHETVGNLGYFLIGLHALVALFHHYIRRDNTLLRMLPGRD